MQISSKIIKMGPNTVHPNRHIVRWTLITMKLTTMKAYMESNIYFLNLNMQMSTTFIEYAQNTPE